MRTVALAFVLAILASLADTRNLSSTRSPSHPATPTPTSTSSAKTSSREPSSFTVKTPIYTKSPSTLQRPSSSTPSRAPQPSRSSSKASATSGSLGRPCSTETVSSLASALSTYGPAGDYCQSLYPQSTYVTMAEQAYTYSTSSFTTTSTLCSIGTFGPVRTTSSSRSVPIISSPTALRSSAMNVAPQSTPSKPAITSIASSAKRSSPPLSSVPAITTTTTGPAAVAYSTLTGLPSSCISSVCSALAGTVTSTSTLTFTFYAVVATSYAPFPEACNKDLDFCDISSTRPVCRPIPADNACTPDPDPRVLTTCTSSNGCAGNCFFAKGNNQTLGGVCIEMTDYVYTDNTILRNCGRDADCGRGEICGQSPIQGQICFEAASESCNGGRGQGGLSADGQVVRS